MFLIILIKASIKYEEKYLLEFNEPSMSSVLNPKIKPVKYFVQINPDFVKDEFHGILVINIKADKTNKIILQKEKLTESGVDLYSQEGKRSEKIKVDSTDHLITITTDNNLNGDYTISMLFKGKMSENLKGFYISKYKDKKVYSTQFEPNWARAAFPCFDEPSFKAPFVFYFTVPLNYQVLFNTEIYSQRKTSTRKQIIFKETPAMSSYILAWVIFEETVEFKELGIFKAYALNGIERTEFALETAKSSYEFFTNYFRIDLPLNKIDLVAVPEFASGAMENWGLITFRETSMLYDSKKSSIKVKQLVMDTVCHEIAHQWFGNLVTMVWWNDLWLNEGFATWASTLAMEFLKPDWDVDANFVSYSINGGLKLDGLISSHPIEVQINDPNEIEQIFDAISYNKASSIIYMVNNYLGAEVMRERLREYLGTYSGKNATSAEFWTVLSGQHGNKEDAVNLVDVFANWTKKKNFPLVTVSYMNSVLTLSQRPFKYKQQEYYLSNIPKLTKFFPPDEKTIWHIPLDVTYFRLRPKKTFFLSEESMSFNTSGDFLVNLNNGFFRVYYEEDRLYRPLRQNMEKLTAAQKVKIISDLFANSLAGFYTVVELVDHLNLFNNEREPDVVSEICRTAKTLFILNAQQTLVKKFSAGFIANKKVQPKFDLVNLSSAEIENAGSIISLAVLIGNSAIIKGLSDQIFTGDVHPILRQSAYESYLLINNEGEKSTAALKKVFDVYLNSDISDERVRALMALPFSKNTDEVLNLIMTDKIKTADLIYIFSSFSFLKPDLFCNWFIENYEKIYELFKFNNQFFGFVFDRSFRNITNRETWNKLVDKIQSVDISGYDMSVANGLEFSNILISYLITNK